jgi:hypothetical protein
VADRFISHHSLLEAMLLMWRLLLNDIRVMPCCIERLVILKSLHIYDAADTDRSAVLGVVLVEGVDRIVRFDLSARESPCLIVLSFFLRLVCAKLAGRYTKAQ